MPAVGENHEETADDGEVAQEEVEVEDETVAEGLRDDDAEETVDGVFRVLAGDDEGGAGEHYKDVGEEEDVRDAVVDCPWLTLFPSLFNLGLEATHSSYNHANTTTGHSTA